MFSRRPGPRFNRGRIATAAGSSAPPSTPTPPEILGATLIQRITANAASITHSSGAVSQWNTSAGTDHYTQATGTAQPAYYPIDLSVGSNDGSLPGLDYVHLDGTSDFMDSALNRPAPGTEPTFFYLIVRQWAWQNLDRVFAGVSTANTMILYQTPTTPTLGTFNTTGPANDNVGPRFTPITNEWMLVMGTFTNSAGAGSWPNQTGDWLMIQNQLVAAENAGNSASTGRRIGQDTAGSRFSAIDLYELGYANAVPNAAKLQQLVDWARSIMPAGVAWHATDMNIVCEGDSQTAGNGGGGSITPYPSYLTVGTRKLKIANVATGGETSVNTAAQYAAQVGARYNQGTAPAVKNVATLFIGTNDLVADATGAAIWANIQTWCTAANASGYHTVVATIPRSRASGGGYSPGQDDEREALNVLIRAGEGADFDVLVELADNGVDGDPFDVADDAVNFFDAYHLTTAAHTNVIAPRFNAALATL